MSNAELWAEALNFSGQDALQASVLRHVRDAVREGGYVRRGRITSGIKESFRPLAQDEQALRSAIDDAIGLLMRAGDLDELATGAGRGYAATPPRRIIWGGSDDVVLGGVDLSSGETVRHAAAAANDLIAIPLVLELGRPAWRDGLVELGGGDHPAGNATALSGYVRALTTSGERYSLEQPSAVCVLSGTGDFFGSPDGPTGRWARVEHDGFFPAVVESGYTKRRVMLAIDGGAATLWEPPSRDIWDWIVVGETLAAGQPVWRYDKSSQQLDFLTPPPRQAERGALLTGEQISPWSWRVDAQAHAIIAGLLGVPPA